MKIIEAPKFQDSPNMFGKKPYLATLKYIHDALHMIKQWREHDHYDSCMKYSARAEGLIELLEGANCGSHGGFDGNQGLNYQPARYTRDNGQWFPKLHARFIWLCLRYIHYHGENADVQQYLDTIEETI